MHLDLRHTTAESSGRLIEQAFQICTMHDRAAPISPDVVSKALKGIPHVLVGGFAMPVHTGKARATMDVDMVVGEVAKAERAITKAFPSLTKLDCPGEDVSRFADETGQEIINLLHPVGRFKVPLSFTVRATVHGTTMKVASFEAMLVAKFHSFHSPYRDKEGVKRDDLDLTALILARPEGSGRKGSINWDKVLKILAASCEDPTVVSGDEQRLRRLVDQTRQERAEFDRRMVEARQRGDRTSGA
jgi:hypothetical protein